ncbi:MULTISPECIES: hypothetical protein [unclassified Pseudomonas]|uniref:hypothetical protein n=1 Tax=unclassified Pseudomonas TaxID=196821 RepID=UPI002449D8C7|nr:MULTISPECIES: hypothetical protein [unclassified Pseudomonas]MDH0892781.1 outer membrane protein assembly factor BamE [Pseudomonas sp. GD03875]MDH1063559.1 outer membrane protein assembly factor BamE [Pseudomonas sp. GD03985]
MLRVIRAGICASLLYPAIDTQATTVLRCEDATGHVTYTLHGCPESASQDLQEARNPTPGKGKAVPLAKTGKARAKTKDEKEDEPQLVVVGTRQDGCGNRLSSSERRSAVIRQEVRGGMSRRDVESALGTPDKVTSTDGQTRYHYADRQGNRRQVTFDEHGCVKEKGKR